jgi:hypothetical protein
MLDAMFEGGKVSKKERKKERQDKKSAFCPFVKMNI